MYVFPYKYSFVYYVTYIHSSLCTLDARYIVSIPKATLCNVYARFNILKDFLHQAKSALHKNNTEHVINICVLSCFAMYVFITYDINMYMYYSSIYVADRSSISLCVILPLKIRSKCDTGLRMQIWTILLYFIVNYS